MVLGWLNWELQGSHILVYHSLPYKVRGLY